MANDVSVVRQNVIQTLSKVKRDIAEAAKAKDLPRLTAINDRLSAIQHLSKKEGLEKSVQDDIAESRIVTQRHLGTIMAEMKEAGVRAGKGKPKKAHDAPFKLSDMGVDRTDSQRWQKIATIEEARLRQHLADIKASGKEVTVAETLRLATTDGRKKKKSAKLKSRADQFSGSPTWTLVCGDSAIETAKLDAGSFRLVFADPPYNIGINYGDGAKADQRSDADYLGWCETWLSNCFNLLTEDGSAWVMIGDEYAGEYAVTLKRVGFTIRNWIKWYETFGVNCTDKFNRCSRHIFYCVKDPKHFVFNADAVTRPSDRQTKYGDKRADADGKLWDDVWQIPRLTATCDERLDGFPTQVPLKILRAIVGCASDPGDTVLDPFSGSASTGVAAIESGRLYVGIEKQKRFLDLSELRLKGAACQGH